MAGEFEMSFEAFNAVLLAVFAGVPIVMLFVVRRDSWGTTMVYRMSVRAKLPIDSWDMWRSIRDRSRALVGANMWGLLVSVALMAALLVWTPLGSSPFALWILTLTLVIGVLGVASAIVGVRERLFSPAPTAVRIARPSALATRDYLPGWASQLPRWSLGAGAAGGAVVTAVSLTGAISPTTAVTTVVALAFALVVAVVCRVAERRVLAQPQPATNTLELGWDDLFRADALGALRMSAAMAAWLPLGLAMCALFLAALGFADPGVSRVLQTFPWFGIPFIQVVYTLASGRLPARLYPEYLRGAPEPAPAYTGGAPA
ncbi:hypothetical protein J2X85_002862 [Microbacterium trichothecenolyticum]|uniref:hypothetical protein n=1 Tax=Microbacterium trichothecenolyticum TaxID=69370 RepID=UPI002861DD5C|nr:hypothetical protein [Microbacterium trichothecenolyticum]MDR7185826.1 hypothetical protein [Microbacterium trichothecenolyticum]